MLNTTRALLNFVVLVTTSLLCQAETMNLASPDFAENTSLPRKFTCDGQNISPTLIISGIPARAVTLALIVDDPDAPMGTWVHWVVYDIPVTGRISEGAVPGKQGTNDFGRLNWGGPCPPSGTHRYFFKLYALDAELGLKEGANKDELERAMQSHVLARSELIGLYTRR